MERALRKRSNASKAALSSLLRHMDAERLRADSRVTQSFATSSPEAAEELQKLQSGGNLYIFGVKNPCGAGNDVVRGIVMVLWP